MPGTPSAMTQRHRQSRQLSRGLPLSGDPPHRRHQDTTHQTPARHCWIRTAGAISLHTWDELRTAPRPPHGTPGLRSGTKQAIEQATPSPPSQSGSCLCPTAEGSGRRGAGLRPPAGALQSEDGGKGAGLEGCPAQDDLCALTLTVSRAVAPWAVLTGGSCALSGPNEVGGPEGQRWPPGPALACAASHPDLPSRH